MEEVALKQEEMKRELYTKQSEEDNLKQARKQ